MTLNVLIAAGGLLAFAVIGTVVRLRRTRSHRIATDQLSGEWLAQARGREEQQW